MSKIAIRVEHPSDKCGMYGHYGKPEGDWLQFPYNRLSEMSDRHGRDFDTPEEEGLEYEKGYYCAFKNMKEARHWIKPRDYKVLVNEEGFKVYRLKLKDSCQIGHFQIVFKDEDVLEKEDITGKFVTPNKEKV